MKSLNSPFKRKALHKEATQIKPQVLFAQETHVVDKTPGSFKLLGFPHIIQANATSKKRGVFIVIHNTVLFQETLVIKDPESRYIILICLLDNVAFTLVNVYALNSVHVRFPCQNRGSPKGTSVDWG